MRLAEHPKVVAIGEAGLDYHYDNSPREAQAAGLRTHIAAARETGLPLVIHAREADADIAAILREETAKGAFPAVLHCFSSGAGVGGGRHRARALRLVLRHPDLQELRGRCAISRATSPPTASWWRPTRRISRRSPHRGKRNEPAFVAHTAAVLAEARGVTPDEIAAQTTENFFRLFSKVPRR